MRLVTPASRRRFTVVALPLCLAAGVAVAAAPSAAVTADEPESATRTRPPVVLRFTASPAVPDESVRTLRREVEAIWRREGLEVQWLGTPAGTPLTPAAIRVVVVDRDRDAARTDHEWPVATLLLDDLDRPVAVSSLAAAERVLDAGTDRAEPGRLRQRRLGLVLGRALAHEIGHYLLNTASHAERGLMRARINARDLVDLRNGGFFLDARAARWLHDAFGAGPAPDARPAPFDYLR